ncbi:MAG: LysR family transcriptional regulator [Gammaproteobacteria bacterium]|nr:LysR family transcriptional regulator [Gammaproteobacteria bacterium]MBT8151949.1 LysR family transcriptional regulator [Gammaproteobacteria bacterium]NND39146.1 LysR family transcriptional regulator [Pseudomonadales bacterium]NNM11635.1 LysR family transcriptional regulator [Pseudomonadales bacterium]RZV54074.1 MAG: LysR family transcriptional regulator [Pseudomonadales bacterium]
MDLELLRTFLEVNRHRHFGRAAEVLHVTQAAVSARIKQLEAQLGAQLFIRQYHNLQLTPEGNRLVRHADALLAGWRKARQEVVLGGARQQLTFGGSLRLWDVALQTWFHRLRHKLPALAVIAEMHTPELLTRRLLDGHLDIAFMLEPAQIETLQIEKVALVELLMVSASPGMDVNSALEGDYLMVDWGLAHALEHRRMHPDAPEPRVRVAQAKMAMAHLLELGGSAYLPARMVAAELERAALFLVDGAESITRYAYAVYPLRSEKLELITTVLDYFDFEIELDKQALLESQQDVSV